jgi:hypothetical protein
LSVQCVARGSAGRDERALNVHCVARGSAYSEKFENQVFYSGDFEDACLLGCDALLVGR